MSLLLLFTGTVAAPTRRVGSSPVVTMTALGRRGEVAENLAVTVRPVRLRAGFRPQSALVVRRIIEPAALD